VHRADAHRFFADVEMQKATDFLARVELGALFFEPPDPNHVA
jgi:hypothetical protein